MCETSKRPAASRTARCSSVTPLYCTGISQPANGTIFAPSFTCSSWREVACRAAAGSAWVDTRRDLAWIVGEVDGGLRRRRPPPSLQVRGVEGRPIRLEAELAPALLRILP